MDKFAVRVTSSTCSHMVQRYVLKRQAIRNIAKNLIEYTEIESIERTVGEEDMPVNVSRNYKNCLFKSHQCTVHIKLYKQPKHSFSLCRIGLFSYIFFLWIWKLCVRLEFISTSVAWSDLEFFYSSLDGMLVQGRTTANHQVHH